MHDSPRKRKKYETEGDESDYEYEESLWVPISVLESSLGPQTFEDIINTDLPELLEVREKYLAGLVEMNHLVRTLD